MKIVKHSWMLVLAFLSVSGNSVAGIAIGDVLIAHAEKTAEQGLAPVQTLYGIRTHRLEVPRVVVKRLAIQAVKGSAASRQRLLLPSGHGSLQLSGIKVQGRQLVLIGHRLVTGDTYHRGVVPLWLEEVRLTLPRQFMANSWDVLSLQRELERLGIKVNPKPAAPKPTPQLSG